MIISALKGGLGNMMFQVSAGKALALDIGASFFYTLDAWISVTPHPVNTYPASIFSRLQPVSIREHAPRLLVYKERGFSYSKLPSQDNLVLDGYFQTAKYFDHHREAIKNIWDLPRNKAYSDYTFIHIRRSDYLPRSNVHCACPISYYREGLAILGSRKVVVISDDIAWCKGQFTDACVEFSTSRSDLEDLSIMASCNKAVIANSTFSWWGAWLSADAQVVAPAKWFGPKGPTNWQDIYCRNWIVI